MKEIRITFGDEAFAAVSKSLIDLGVIFQVEPLESGDKAAASVTRTESATSTTRSRQSKNRSPKTGPKGTPAAQGVGAKGLREIVARNRASSGEREQRPERTAVLPEDLSAKLLPYGERREE
jgi:hypothetical protein